jgi:Domain of unknown function (DUF6895)
VLNWDESDIVKRLCRALDIAKRAVTLFSERGYMDREISDNSFRPDKPIAETAMLLYAASGARRHPDVAKRIDEIAHDLAPLARSKRIMLSMALHPSVCVEFAVPHILLSQLGFKNEQFDLFLQLCLNSQASRGHERPPFASLEKRWIIELWSGVDPGPGWQVDLEQSVLNWPIDLLGGLREDAYALTHLAIYCTDFGFHVKPLPRPRSLVLAEARSFLAKCLDEEDYDLAAELVMLWPQLGAPWCASSAFGFRVLSSVEDQVGVLPSVRTKADRLNKLEGEDKTLYAYATAYHTSLVMGLLCATSLHPGKTPPAQLVGPTVEKNLIDQLLCFIDADQGHWQPVFAALPESERVTLAPLLLDIALAQKFRQHDYDAANQLLKIAANRGMDPSPLSVQATEMLERLAAFSQTIDAHA